MADTKQTKTIGEHWVASELARRDWAPALTRDGLERTDILAVKTVGERLQIEVQVKSARGIGKHINWPLGLKAQQPPLHDHEWFVMVAIDPDVMMPLRGFVIPRAHVAAAAWIAHMEWLTEPGVPAGKRNAGVENSRVYVNDFAGYEGRWDLLDMPAPQAPVLLPERFRELARDPRVGLPTGHPWHEGLPERWDAETALIVDGSDRTVTPVDLARELGHLPEARPGLRVREYLRAKHPDHSKWQRWQLTEAEANDVRRHFAGEA